MSHGDKFATTRRGSFSRARAEAQQEISGASSFGAGVKLEAAWATRRHYKTRVITNWPRTRAHETAVSREREISQRRENLPRRSRLARLRADDTLIALTYQSIEYRNR